MNANLKQCPDCNGWLSRQAVFCPSCGAPGPAYETVKTNVGWSLVKGFWLMVFTAVILSLAL